MPQKEEEEEDGNFTLLPQGKASFSWPEEDRRI